MMTLSKTDVNILKIVDDITFLKIVDYVTFLIVDDVTIEK